MFIAKVKIEKLEYCTSFLIGILLYIYIDKIVLNIIYRYLATTSADKTIKIWNVEDSFSLDKTLIGHTRWVWDCSFSADSAYLVSGIF